jgi:hypothetical protein
MYLSRILIEYLVPLIRFRLIREQFATAAGFENNGNLTVLFDFYPFDNVSGGFNCSDRRRHVSLPKG